MKKQIKNFIIVAFLMCGAGFIFIKANPEANANQDSLDNVDLSVIAQRAEEQEKRKNDFPVFSKDYKGGEMAVKPLTKEEEHIILNKGTERPYSGELLDNKKAGLYVCRQCNAPLYHSEDKFDSQCGWPSFDDEIAGSVLRVPDADGRRTEIVCANCGGHLGHVFENEGFTAKNLRHCVNSISMQFVEDVKRPSVAYFGGGCFWGVEDGFQSIEGVNDVVSGYMGGHTNFPTYEEVVRGDTGHAEVVRVLYDADKVDFESLARFFFEIHDPTQVNRQGVDVGTQYRSVLFYTDDEQKEIALKLKNILIDKGYKVATEILPAPPFFPAEDYHQDFTQRTGRGGCHLPVKRFDS